MALQQSAKPSASVEDLSKRILGVAERFQAMSIELAEEVLRKAVVPSEITEELAEVELFIRDLSRDSDILSDYGRQDLADARNTRRELRALRDECRKPAQARSGEIRSIAAQVYKAARRLDRAPEDEVKLQALLGMLLAYFPVHTPEDGRTLKSVAKAFARIRSTDRPTAMPFASADVDKARRPEPPEPADVEFESANERLLKRVVRGDFDAPGDYSLNREAQYLSLATGFEELLCLPLLRGVEHFEFQINTAKQVLRHMRGRALLCDEVGLGKTIEAGIILKEYAMRSLANRVLILTPPSLVSQWREQMDEKFGLRFVCNEDAEFRTAGSNAWSRFERVIASLHSARLPANFAAIQAGAYDMLIVDEAHHLKNRSTVSWKFVNGIKSKYVLLLTATPAQNDLDELFNLITLLSPGQSKTPQAFRREFVEKGDPRQPKNRTKLQELLMDVMVRNSRRRVSVGLPPRRAHTIRFDFTPAERALYDGVTETVRKLVRQSSGSRMSALTLQTEAGSSVEALSTTLSKMVRNSKPGSDDLKCLQSLASEASVHTGAKLTGLVSLLARTADKAIVFTQFVATQHRILEALNAAGIGAAAFAGGMSAAQKDEQIAAFSAGSQVLVSTDVGSEGRNLQFCHTVINFDLPWNPMRIEQRVGRVHRIGQSEPVTIFNLTAKDTVEDYVLQVLDSKINMFELVVGEVGEILGNLDDDREFDDIVMDIWAQAVTTESASEAFSEFGDRLLAAQNSYRRSCDYDDALFGDEFGAEV